ncbi:MAG: hypothetical protein R6V83_14545 [Candidatus Thorarchaeota archaeon]
MEKQVVYQSESPNPIPLTCLSIDKAGKRAACGTTEGQILLIDLEEGTPLKTLTGHEDIVSKVRFLEKGAHLLSSSWDGTTRCWSLQKTKNEPSILKHDSAVKSLAIAKDENKGAAGARSGEVKVFSVQYMKCIRNIQADNPDVLGLHFRNGDSQLLSASWNGSCCVWNLKDYEMLSTLHEDDTRIRCFEVTPDDTQVLLGLHDERIRVFSAEDPSDAFTLEGHTDRITDFAILPDNRLVSSSWDRTIRLWSLNDEEELQQVKLWSGVCSVQWCTACEKLFATDLSGSLLAWRF